MGAAYVVVSWLIIQVVETIFPAFGFGDPAVRITTIALAIGLIPTLIFAWAFELTPDGLKKESEVDRSQSILPQTGKKLDRMIMVSLALALGYFAFDNFVLDPQREEALLEANKAAVKQAREEGRTQALEESYGDKSIAVLAFDDMSPDGDQEYLSDGIAEELLNLLARIPELRVISRSSAFTYKGKDIKLDQIAAELNVAYILEGSVRKAGNRIRVTTQLIEARTDTHLWSETYNRALDDVFAIQDDISASVVEQLKIELLGDAPHAAETDPEAYALYLEAEHLALRDAAETWEKSNALFKEALAIDPSFAPAWSGLATNFINQGNADLIPLNEALYLARGALDKAMAIDPNHANAHRLLGVIAMLYESNIVEAARHIEKAVELEPSIGLSGDTSSLLMFLGRTKQAIAVDEYRVARDPLNASLHSNLAHSYLVAGQWEDALISAQVALRLSPQRIFAHYYAGLALLQIGDTKAALEEFGKETDAEFRTKGQALALHTLGEHEEYQAKLQELIKGWGDIWPSEVAHVFAYAGDVDAAFQWLRKSVSEEEGGFIPQVPLLASLRDDPRWLPLLEEMGKAPAQLDVIKFDVKLPPKDTS